ncbi:RNAi-Induced Longevity [Caenorhabditis elegans]|uniref:RNAi-Induced Longevity n=1 Tax=Caenorhabditis elegans TaxID=6239 RepID=E3W740_CAEEL|nr:RNAi-Induced Longevity [Caenorhabditis elegans]CBX53314.1 RNAi-Induced Longevity [Caenorhabditis elegans]|eukprot:NP_001256436.1 RNAi-Induced Longevity [Caenorhabditis elegans]
MWRFAVYTQKATILNKTCLTAVRQSLKHTDGRFDYFRYLGNDASHAISVQKDQQIREVFSLDDFGLLSMKSQSLESISSAGNEHNFLDQLFRNDTLNAFSNVQIPTTVSSKELGGSNDIFGYDYVSELLSEGAIPEEIAEDLAMSTSSTDLDVLTSSSEPASYYDDQEPSTSGLEVTNLPFLMPKIDQQSKENRDSRQLMSEHIRRERKLNLSTTTPVNESDAQLFHVPESLNYQNIGHMLFPDSLPPETYTSQWKEGELPSISSQISSTETSFVDTATEFSLEHLEDLIADGAVDELHKLLKSLQTWPEWMFTGNRQDIVRINDVLRFIVENLCSEESEIIIRNFCGSHVLAEIPEDIIIHFTLRSITPECEVSSIMNNLETSSQWAHKRELRPNRMLVKTRLSELYAFAIQKSPEKALSLFSLCSKLNLDRTSDIFMKCYGETRASSDNFLKSFGDWKLLSNKYGTQQGIDDYWMAALKSDAKGLDKRIEALLLHSGKGEHPFATMARMICTLLKLARIDEALEVFQKVSVSGKHFKQQLASFVEQNDLECIERLAMLVERGMIAEKRRGGGGRSAVNKSVIVSVVSDRFDGRVVVSSASNLLTYAQLPQWRLKAVVQWRKRFSHALVPNL